MLTKIKIILLIPVIFSLNILKSQSISLSGDIFEYATYYISSFDFGTGATSVQIFRYELSSDIKLGEKVMIDQFNVGDILTVSGTSKGKGFAGHMKRHNFGGGRASHGKNSVMRKAGSIGAGTSPGRVWKGTRMAGRMGGDKVTIKNLELVKVDQENNLLFVSGYIPGPNKNIVYISKV